MESHEESWGVIGEHGEVRVVEEIQVVLSVRPSVCLFVCLFVSDFVGY